MEMIVLQLEQRWYKKSLLTTFLLPLSWLFCLIVILRRMAYDHGIFKRCRILVPVVVVGNISVGGSGKTPLVIKLVEILKEAGYLPGVISRGYKGNAKKWPQQVRPDSDPDMVGDEAVLISRHCSSPMAVGPDRVAAARALLEHSDCDIIISDDGLQHYALERDIEIVVVDGVRRHGNGHCLPAGPLREPIKRLEEVDIVVSNGIAGRHEYAMSLKGSMATNLVNNENTCSLDRFKGRPVHAVAGVGNPARFFTHLRSFGLTLIEHPMPDHHRYLETDLQFNDDLPVIMTEKDAVKCGRIANDSCWYVPVDAEIDPRMKERFLNILNKLGKRSDN
jgi:tetraacyldisaccharide 4'-kinase